MTMTLRRLLAACLAPALAVSAFPAESWAAFARVPEVPSAGLAEPLTAAPAVVAPLTGPSAYIPSYAPALSLPSSPVASAPSAELPATEAYAEGVPLPHAVSERPVQVSPAAPAAAPERSALPAVHSKSPSPSRSFRSASALFDGAAALPAASESPETPELPDAPAAAPSRPRPDPRYSLGLKPRPKGALSRAGSFVARATGVRALWGLYHDGVVLQRLAARLSDPEQPVGRRVRAVRGLASGGSVDAVPLLSWAAENDPAPRVRRAARAGLHHMAADAAPRLIRALRVNPLAVSRERAAVDLGRLAAVADLPAAVEALGRAGLMDRSEGARQAAVQGLGDALGAEAAPTLAWMLAVEKRPTMRAALERARDRLHARRAEEGSLHLVPPAEDLPLAAAPLHAAALKSSIFVGLTFAAVEFAGGVLTGATALQADALHLAGDRALDGAALFAMWIGKRPPTSRHTYGWLKAESVFAFAGALVIGALGLGLVPAVVHGLLHPAAAAGWSVAWLAGLSVTSNLISALMLMRHRGAHMGVRGAFLHALTDALGTVGLIGATAASLLWGWNLLTPIATAALVVMILRVAWELGKPAWNALLDAVPPGLDMDALETDLRGLPGVAGVYDLHVRSLNSQGADLAAKLYARPGADRDAILAEAGKFLRERYGIVHATIQVEAAPAAR
jgi:cobalt-zinc-cadmium efflux system protein